MLKTLEEIEHNKSRYHRHLVYFSCLLLAVSAIAFGMEFLGAGMVLGVVGVLVQSVDSV